MIPELRKEYNKAFNPAAYDNFIHNLKSFTYYPIDFRVSETPLFLSGDLTGKLIEASNDLLSQLSNESFKVKSQSAIPENQFVPNDTPHPCFLCLDFAITKNKSGIFEPKLIELQGFPSLFGYQVFLDRIIRKHFKIPDRFTNFFNGLDELSYINLLKKVILADHDPKNVVLLEIDPHLQKTRVDFACTQELTGIRIVNLSEVIKKGRQLYYLEGGKEIPIQRIYNRVIYDELERKNFKFNFNFTDDLDVEWAGHPNWFFKISKHSLPSLKGKYVPRCFFLNELEKYPADLENFVLKPLFSFAGLGVEVDVTEEMLKKISNKSNYILQEKVEYAPVIETPDEFAKVEIRLMILWDEKPVLATNLIRTSKGKMMGVDFNKNKTWVGSNIAYHLQH
ncbi:MAG: hypothetical protein HXY50_07305 [Ignavibacteriaceae bacterium]|nr:hypothetical protein [Ignavibacteriaceae bacterium]